MSHSPLVPLVALVTLSYTRAAKIARARALAKSSNSFGALDKISSLIHNVEAQKVGSVAKVQLCSESMNWFVGQVQKGGKVRNRERTKSHHSLTNVKS